MAMMKMEKNENIKYQIDRYENERNWRKTQQQQQQNESEHER
jgi:hypothetical protein